MSQATVQPELLQAAQSQLAGGALSAVRRTALDEFARSGLPTLRDEDWRYTNLAPVNELSNDWLRRIIDAGGDSRPEARAASLPDLDVHWLVLHDGRVDDASLAALGMLAESGVTVRRIADCPDTVTADGPYDRLNAALLQDGVHISVAADAVLERPLAIYFNDGVTTVSQARVVVDVASGARIDLVEYHASGTADAHFANNVTQLNLAAGARAALVRVQDRDRSHFQVGKLTASLHADAVLDYASFDFGGALVRQDVFTEILEPGALVRLHGLYLADGDQHIDNHTRVDHRVGPAQSREEFRGILNGNARCVFNGKAIVHVGADGTDAEQANHNLLLSAKAEIDTKPELEIYADDVKCSHGATVGQLDDNALFYMQSRGIDRDRAQHLLTRAFAGQILRHLPIDALQEHLVARIDERLDTLLEETVT